MFTIPVVRRGFVDRAAFGLPFRKNFPIVVLAIAAMPPIGWTGQNQVDADGGQEREEIKRITPAKEPSTLFNFGFEPGSNFPQILLTQRHILDGLVE